MIIENILTPERTRCSVHGTSKKKILEMVANLISDEVPAINAKDLFSSLIFRERLGTTGLGRGVAIPHCRNKACTEPIGLFIRLDEPVDFESVDHSPVDLVFALVVPEEETQEHLNILRVLASRFQSDSLLHKMREANNATALYNYITADQ